LFNLHLFATVYSSTGYELAWGKWVGPLVKKGPPENVGKKLGGQVSTAPPLNPAWALYS